MPFVLLFSLKRYPQNSYAWAIPEIQAFEQLNKSPSPDNSLLFLGSSSIRLWETLAEDMAPHPVIQRGYGGAHLRDAIFFPDALIGNYHPAVIIGFIANDIKGVEEDERPARSKTTVSVFFKASAATPARYPFSMGRNYPHKKPLGAMGGYPKSESFD